MGVLAEPLRRLSEYLNIEQYAKEGRYPIGVTGCVDSQKGHFIANLGEKAPCRLVITWKEEKAREMYEDLSFFDRNTLHYPSKDILFYSADVHSNHTAMKRMKVLKRLQEGEPLTIVLCFDVLMEKMMPPEAFRENVLTIGMDSVIKTDELRRTLVEMGYQSGGLVEGPGEFSVRGDIVDIFPLTEDSPVRIELWGDEIDSMRSFDVESQRSIENLEQIRIYPASEIVLQQEKMPEAIRRMKEEYDHQEKIFQKEKKRQEKGRLRKMVEATEDELSSLGTAAGSETLLSYFYGETASFLDYLPEGTLLFVDEPQRVEEKGRTTEQEFSLSMQSRLEGGYVLPTQADLLYGCEETVFRIQQRPTLLFSGMIQQFDLFEPKVSVHIEARSIYSYNNSFDQLIKDLQHWRKEQYQMMLMSASATRARRLAEDIRDEGLPAYFAEDYERTIQPGEVMVTCGRLNSGFEYPTLKFVVLSEKDIFKERRQKSRKKKSQYSGQKIRSLADISIGDYVVHEKYGLGIYRGMEQIETDGVAKDYINIEYKDSSNLFIPASQLDIIQKYAGAGAKKPKLNKLGGNEWEKTKSRVRSQVQIAAKDLVELYAQRQAREGYAYGPDTVWQTEFEELFPYEETEDQLSAIEDTKRDMESHKIMDRLICGDVGYGKTEIAIRAAFKAVMESKQVVYLVPTTILAQQHYNSFVERMKHYPIKICMLSRFCTPKETRQIQEALKKGTMDIVIGTHKVLSKSIQYKNLGLLIIDEEQRFGVKQKEKIKQLKKDVDVLTLSATPIPRTLHMSLAGIRDMSVLEMPPVDRRPIQTYVMEYNEEMVREAIERELARGGQVFYVYNRVNDIDSVAADVQKLVPGAVVEFAHGQMGERQLEQIMFAFINKEIDVLVSTTIIETGLDISNANTIIIHDAQNFGLSQLYQLRGRVGRSNRTAYAFLMYRRNTILKEEAEKRLKAIREFTDLGSGFKIAMRDLEIRGAGNLLGAEQSGHMEAVGYDLYCKMLNDAVMQMKGEKQEEDTFDTSVDLSIDAYIPAAYVGNESQKLELYKRIAVIENQEEYEDLIEELTDRYGDVPAPTLRLMDVALLKQEAHRAWILAIEQKGTAISFVMNARAKVKVDEIDDFLKSFRGRMRIRPETNPVFVYDPGEIPKKDLLPRVREIITKIAGLLER
ncbi:MAG: transcription-repair coupling factor [Clostridiales bacterium]|nr:transcription-repair coupling factor [Clostridiales bacterium]